MEVSRFFRILLQLLGKLWVIVKPLLSAFIGLWLLSIYNVFDSNDYLKQIDKSFEIGVTVYFAVIDILLSLVTSYINKTLLKKQYLEILFSVPGMQGVVNAPTILKVIPDQPAEAVVSVRIKAKRKTVENVKITLPAIVLASMQPSMANKAISLDVHGNYQINISALIGNSTYVSIEQGFRILFLKEPFDEVGKMDINPELNKYPILLNVSTNILRVYSEV